MNTIKLNNHNIISFHNTIWNDAVLGYKTNEISNFNFSSINSGIETLRLFEIKSVNDNVKYSTIRIDSNCRESKFILESEGYYNVETSIRVETTLNRVEKNDFFEKFKFDLIPADSSDIDSIKKISTNEFRHGRFFEDSKIANNVSQQRNINWIDNLYENSNLVVGKKNDKVFAFMSYKITNSEVNFELGGVDSNYSHLAYPFWYRVMMGMKYKNLTKINALISATNLNVVNLYSHFGFKFSNSFLGYRKFRN